MLLICNCRVLVCNCAEQALSVAHLCDKMLIDTFPTQGVIQMRVRLPSYVLEIRLTLNKKIIALPCTFCERPAHRLAKANPAHYLFHGRVAANQLPHAGTHPVL